MPRVFIPPTCVFRLSWPFITYNYGISLPFETLSLIFHGVISLVARNNHREMIGSCKNLMERRDLTGDFKLSGV